MKSIKLSMNSNPEYWLTPVNSWESKTLTEVIRNLLEQDKIFALGERAHGRDRLKPGDWICFYAAGEGIVAQIKVWSDSLPKSR